MESKVDKLINLILEDDLLFDIISTWKTLPVYYTVEGSDYLHRISIELNEAEIEDCFSIVDRVTKELQVYYGNSFSISVDNIVEFLRIHKKTIEKAIIREPNDEITIEINQIGYTVTIDKLYKTLLNYAGLSSDVKIVRIVYAKYGDRKTR